MGERLMAEYLKFSPNILRRLGEELVPDVDQGIIELVKNAYDADATECQIKLNRVTSGNGAITISDNGTGMTEDQIKQGWLVIGRSGKSKGDLTPKYNRVPVGDKGLGRLAALRLGALVKLRTRPAAEPGTQYEVVLDWAKYDAVDVVEDVPLEIKASKSERAPGTDILVERISSKITRTTVNKLAKSLLLLSDPFLRIDENQRTPKQRAGKKSQDDPGFTAGLTSRDFKDIQSKVGHSYFSDAEYRIQAEVGEHGNAIFRILDWKGQTLHEFIDDDTYHCPTFVFDLWSFVLNKASFSTKASTLTEVRDWLGELGGVHIYEDGIRVPPYGGSENDWLSLNLRRARSPEVRPSTNTSVGRVKLSNTEGMLVQKTDRIGYLENFAFSELKRACGEALDWAARVLLKERDRRRETEKQDKKERAEKATTNLNKVLSKTVKPTERRKVENAIASYVRASEKEADSLREDLQLYRSLATAGMTSAVFAHEIGRPLKLIDTAVKSLIRLIPDDERKKVEKRVSRVTTSKKRLNSFVSIPLQLLAKQKRRSGIVFVNSTLSDIKETVKPISDYYDTEVNIIPSDKETKINGTEALVDGIVLNMMLNSFNAFQREGFDTAERKIRIQTRDTVRGVEIRFSDNAGGIDGVPIEDIWLPGVTTTPDGTGFGLTIVRDSVKDLNGTVAVEGKTDFGGAMFTIVLPHTRDMFPSQ